MSTVSLTTVIVESVTSDGRRRLQIDIAEGRTVFAIENEYPKCVHREPFWVVAHQPWLGPAFCVDDEETARSAITLVAAAASSMGVAS